MSQRTLQEVIVGLAGTGQRRGHILTPNRAEVIGGPFFFSGIKPWRHKDAERTVRIEPFSALRKRSVISRTAPRSLVSNESGIKRHSDRLCETTA